MSKKRVGLYIEEDVWNVAKEAAWSRKVSLSSYIEGLIEYPDLVQKLANPLVRVEKPCPHHDESLSPSHEPSVDISEKPPKPFIPLDIQSRFERWEGCDDVPPKIDYRAKYQLMNPTKMCPGCRRKNKDCECPKA